MKSEEIRNISFRGYPTESFYKDQVIAVPEPVVKILQEYPEITKRVEELEEERVSILKHKRAIMKAAKFHIPNKKYKAFTDLINELMGKAD